MVIRPAVEVARLIYPDKTDITNLPVIYMIRIPFNAAYGELRRPEYGLIAFLP